MEEGEKSVDMPACILDKGVHAVPAAYVLLLNALRGSQLDSGDTVIYGLMWRKHLDAVGDSEWEIKVPF